MTRAGMLVTLLLTLVLSGCARVMSDKSLSLVDPNITFEELRRNPDAYIGKYVLLGGAIARVKNTKEKGELEVVQTPLDYSGEPEDTQSSGGRFLITTDRFLDPVVYKAGKRVAVVGEVKGKKTRRLDEVDYAYPVVVSVEMHLWGKYETERYYYNYPPPYYNYGPFWGDPWWPYRGGPYPYWW